MLNWEKMRCCGRGAVRVLEFVKFDGSVMDVWCWWHTRDMCAWPECEPCVCCSWPDQRPTHSEQQHTAARASALRWGRLMCRVSCTTLHHSHLFIFPRLYQDSSLPTLQHIEFASWYLVYRLYFYVFVFCGVYVIMLLYVFLWLHLYVPFYLWLINL